MCPLADSTPTVLIVSDDAAGAALLGGLVETFGYRVEFASVRAPDRAGLKRPRVCFLDCESDACSEASVARAIMRGVSVVLVGPRSLLERMRELAGRHGADVLFIPPEPGPLADVLDRAVRRSSSA